MTLTDAQIGKVKAMRRRALPDGAGLYLRVYPSGRRNWIYRYGLDAKDCQVTIGRWPQMKLAGARRCRRRLEDLLAQGESPREVLLRDSRGLRQRITVREFSGRWLAEVVAKMRKDTAPVERYLARDVFPRLGKRTVASVTPWEVREMIFRRRDEGRPESAAALRHLLKRLFDYAKACGVIAENPVGVTPLRYVTQHKARTRSLSEAELRVFLAKVHDLRLGRMGIVLELMLLTLCRKSELRLCRWEHVNFAKAIWEVPKELSKTGQAHVVYLSRQAAELFQRLGALAGRAEMVLPMRDSITEPIHPSALNKAVQRVKWGIPHFVPHDLRRTASTLLNEQGYHPDWIEKALNHGKKDVRGIYNRAQYGPQRKQMLQEWADWLEKL